MSNDSGSPQWLSLPTFDSLPSSEGLTNLQAFRLSLQHALVLLRTPGFKPHAAFEETDASARFRL